MKFKQICTEWILAKMFTDDKYLFSAVINEVVTVENMEYGLRKGAVMGVAMEDSIRY